MRTFLVLLFATALIGVAVEPIPVVLTGTVALISALLLLINTDYGRRRVLAAGYAVEPRREKLRLAA